MNQANDRPFPRSIRFRSYFKIFLDFCQRSGIKAWLLILLLYNFGYSLSITMFRPLLIDLGLSLAEVGWLLGVLGTSMVIAGSLIAGVVITRWGSKRSLLIATALTALGVLTYALPTFGLTQLPVLYGIVGVTSISLGMVVTTAFTVMMEKSRPESAATDYAVQASLNTMGSLPAAAISGLIASVLGYRGVFTISALVVAVCVLLVAKYLRNSDTSKPSLVNAL